MTTVPASTNDRLLSNSALTSAAAPLDPIAFVVENAEILGNGVGKSAGLAAVAVGAEAVRPFVVAFLSLASPPRIPTALLLAAEASESVWTGAYSNPFGLGYDRVVPGFYIPTDITPTGNPGDPHDLAYRRLVDGTVLTATVLAVNRVTANLTEVGVPKVVEQTLLSSEKIGVTVLQARALVRGATVGAVQDTILAASSGGDVGAAIQNGAIRIQKSVFGDPDAPDAHVDPYDSESPTAPSIAQLGAVGSVTTSVQQAANDVSHVLNTSGSGQRGTDLAARQRTVGPVLSATSHRINDTIGAVKSAIGNGRTVVRSASSANGSTAAIPSPARKTPVRDAVSEAREKVVTRVSDSINRALGGGKGDDNHNADEGEGGAQ